MSCSSSGHAEKSEDGRPTAEAGGEVRYARPGVPLHRCEKAVGRIRQYRSGSCLIDPDGIVVRRVVGKIAADDKEVPAVQVWPEDSGDHPARFQGVRTDDDRDDPKGFQEYMLEERHLHFHAVFRGVRVQPVAEKRVRPYQLLAECPVHLDAAERCEEITRRIHRCPLEGDVVTRADDENVVVRFRPVDGVVSGCSNFTGIDVTCVRDDDGDDIGQAFPGEGA